MRAPLIEAATADPALSPDDRWLAFVAAKPNGSAGLFVSPVRDKPVPPEDWISVAEDRNFIGSPKWSPDGRLLYYVSNRDSFSCVWAQPFSAGAKTFGKPAHVYHDRAFPSLKASPGRNMAITADRLYLMLATTESNIWTMNINGTDTTAAPCLTRSSISSIFRCSTATESARFFTAG